MARVTARLGTSIARRARLRGHRVRVGGAAAVERPTVRERCGPPTTSTPPSTRPFDDEPHRPRRGCYHRGLGSLLAAEGRRASHSAAAPHLAGVLHHVPHL